MVWNVPTTAEQHYCDRLSSSTHYHDPLSTSRWWPVPGCSVSKSMLSDRIEEPPSVPGVPMDIVTQGEPKAVVQCILRGSCVSGCPGAGVDSQRTSPKNPVDPTQNYSVSIAGRA